ncbi:MAG: HEAT repeat domain-containing protein [Desulfobulbia bacterium]|nr:MAG: hypothetical protein CVU58_00175 [Deltaproteobacteria bacterium HGW-Deltaproteobacteria-16]
MPPNNFKSDESFLSKIAIGAAGTNATIEALTAMGFRPIELERGSSGYKIWKKIKIKRVRVPDILCLRTGLRFESRGKTKLEISMSHSLNEPSRCWDVCMRTDDYVSIILLEAVENSIVDYRRISPVMFIRVSDMQAAFVAEDVKITTPKGVEEGSEIRVIWPCATANAASVVETIAPNVRLRPNDGGRAQTIRLRRAGGDLPALVQVGDAVEANEIVAACVPVVKFIPLPAEVDEEHFRGRLTSVKLNERYAAAKALRYRGYGAECQGILEARMNDGDEDIYVQLEAAAALAAHNHESGWRFIEDKLRGMTLEIPVATQLETVIVVSEIPTERSERILISVLQDDDWDEEIRAGAAWGLGQFDSEQSAVALVNTFNSNKREIQIEAARALLLITPGNEGFLVDLLKTTTDDKRDGLAWALARSGGFDPASMFDGTSNDNLRRWISYIIGRGQEKFVAEQIEAIRGVDQEVYFAATVLWQILGSWVHDLKEY